MAEKPYVCEDCGAEGVKLWRPYMSFDVHLRCKRCAIADQEPDFDPSAASDEIGWLVPAVPVVGLQSGYWGYASVPRERVQWWKALPEEEPYVVVMFDGYGGRSAVFWKPNHAGYTCDLAKAGIYARGEAESLDRQREIDHAVPLRVARQYAETHSVIDELKGWWLDNPVGEVASD